MQIRSSDSAYLYLLFIFQIITMIGAFVWFCITCCNKERRASQGKHIIWMLILAGVLGKWCTYTIELVQDDIENAEWNPYVLLHVPDDGSFNTKEIRAAYRQLAIK